ncbi:MAG: NAD-binding protein [Chloroflexota bacterium]|nr:NAD-binding protein [Chloroflexota bacterium]
MSAGAISESLNSLILTSSLVTIVLTPGAFRIAPRVAVALGRLPVARRAFAARATVVAGEDTLDQHAIVIGYGRVGRYVAAGLRDTGLAVAVVEQDLHLVQEVERGGFPAIYGDASYRSILDVAHPERARLVVVALPDVGGTRAVVRHARQANDTVPILARVAREEEDDVLRRAGATAVVAPERAGAIMLLEESARVIDVPAPPQVDDLQPVITADGAGGDEAATAARRPA